MRLSIKPTAEKIIEIGDKFLGMFFVLAKEESFLDCLLGLHYAARSIFNFTYKTNICAKENLENIISEIHLAADKNVEDNLKQIDSIVKEIEKNNWEEPDVK